jgi:hypothetical protein
MIFRKVTSGLNFSICIILLCLALSPLGAQDEAGPEETSQEQTVQSGAAKSSKTQTNTLSFWIDKATGYIAQIGAMFGKTTGIRIGGTSVSAIAMLIVAKLIEDKAPPWVKWLLYLSGGTMIAGSGANIVQAVMKYIPL